MDRVSANTFKTAYAALSNRQFDEAFASFSKLAESGNPESQYYLGWCYEQGIGCSADLAKALSWWKAAAKQGHSTSQIAVGYCYELGRGVAVDLITAASWYGIAAQNGSGLALNEFSRVKALLAKLKNEALDA